MKTKEEMIEIIRAENPAGLRTGSNEAGYIDLTAAEYESTIIEWAEARLAKEAKVAADLAEAKAKAIAKAEAAEKLIALGIDPKALGL